MIEISIVERIISVWFEEHRPEPQIREELDWSYSWENSTFILNEVRPFFYDPYKKGIPIVKAKYVKSRNVWKLYWMRSDLKWHAYDPAKEVKSIYEVFKEIEHDEYGCFFG